MAQLTAQFELMSIGTLTASGTEQWVDVLANGPDTNSPIPSGRRVWIAYITCISIDKTATFEIRSNKATKSAGTTADTDLRGFVSVPGGESRDLDVFYGGVIQCLAPISSESTGVEKLWLRISSGSSATANYQFIVYYTLY